MRAGGACVRARAHDRTQCEEIKCSDNTESVFGISLLVRHFTRPAFDLRGHPPRELDGVSIAATDNARACNTQVLVTRTTCRSMPYHIFAIGDELYMVKPSNLLSYSPRYKAIQKRTTGEG